MSEQSKTPRADKFKSMSFFALDCRKVIGELEKAEIELQQAQEELEKAKAYSKEYITQTDAALACPASVDQGNEPPCGTCRACIQSRLAKLEAVARELAEVLKQFQAGQGHVTRNEWVPAAMHYEKAESVLDKALTAYNNLTTPQSEQQPKG